MAKGTVGTDYNLHTDSGLYIVYNTGQANKPPFNSALLVVHNYSTSHIVQVAYSNDSRMAMRQYWAGNWHDWQTFEAGIPSFYKDYTTLSGLATALGLDKIQFLQIIDKNLDTDFNTEGVVFARCRFSTCSGTKPVSEWGTLLIYCTRSASTQITISGSGLYFRIRQDGNWTNWYKLTGDVVSTT